MYQRDFRNDVAEAAIGQKQTSELIVQAKERLRR